MRNANETTEIKCTVVGDLISTLTSHFSRFISTFNYLPINIHNGVFEQYESPQNCDSPSN